MKVGIGFCNDKNALVSGKTIAEQAFQRGGIEYPAFALAFCSLSVDAKESEYRKKDYDVNAVIRRADDAVYYAKANGRDKVILVADGMDRLDCSLP